MSDHIPLAILSALSHRKDFAQRVVTHLKSEYFQNEHRVYFDLFSEYYAKYGEMPNKDAAEIELSKRSGMSEYLFSDAQDLIEQIFSEKVESEIDKISEKWLIDTTESYCLDKSVYNGIMTSLAIIDGTDKTYEKTAIPDILKNSLAITFDQTFGHDYLLDADARYDFYHKKENKIRLPLKIFNDITNGGIPEKSLLLFVAPTGVGKTLMKTYTAAEMLLAGYDVLYVTLEMAEERIAERVDATLMDIPLTDMKMLLRDKFKSKIDAIREKTTGRLIIKEYPPGVITTANIRNLLDDLDMKQDFRPKILMVDYMNLIGSSRVRTDAGSYTIMKMVSEELRAIAVENELLCITSTQTNRGGMGATSYDISEISESVGSAFTADVIWAMISTDELEELGQLRIRQLKNRFGALIPKSFVIGMDRPKMSFFDLDDASDGAAYEAKSKDTASVLPSKKPSKKPNNDLII